MKNIAVFSRSHGPGLVLMRGPRAVVVVVKSDRMRYDAAAELRFFRAAHLPGGPPCLP